MTGNIRTAVGGRGSGRGSGRGGRARSRVLVAVGLLVVGLTALTGCGGADSTGDLATGASAGTSAITTPIVRPGPVWLPAPGIGWQWQLSGTLDTSVDVPVYDVDLFTTSAATVAQLHAQGRKVICYLNVGAAETFRSDYASFPAAVLGNGNGWAGEKWLDVRRLDLIGPIMARRFDLCRQKGFDAVEPDNVDAYDNDSGFPLTADDQVAFNTHIAGLAHARGLSVGLKNDLAQISTLVSAFDFAVNEQCFEFGECAELKPFVSAGKAVFQTEYSGSTSEFCPQAKQLGLSSLLKKTALDGWREAC